MSISRKEQIQLAEWIEKGLELNLLKEVTSYYLLPAVDSYSEKVDCGCALGLAVLGKTGQVKFIQDSSQIAKELELDHEFICNISYYHYYGNGTAKEIAEKLREGWFD